MSEHDIMKYITCIRASTLVMVDLTSWHDPLKWYQRENKLFSKKM